jgi:nucleotide-binding universal stress UspA family protein
MPVEVMIKDVMVRLDGTVADDLRLSAAAEIARRFEGHVTGLFLNILPPPLPVDPEGVGAAQTTLLMEEARAAGDAVVQLLRARLAKLGTPVEIRRFDVFSDEVAKVSARQARTADTFIALRPSGAPEESTQIVEGVLFGSGRHLFLVPPGEHRAIGLGHALVGWNGSREAARALAEALPYLKLARSVRVCVVDDRPPVAERALLGTNAKRHLHHHGINATVDHIRGRKGEVGAALIAEARSQDADLLVMGAYGHSRLREWLLGGVTYEVLHHAPVPLLLAH